MRISKRCDKYYIYHDTNNKTQKMRFKTNRYQFKQLDLNELKYFKKDERGSLKINRWLKGSRKFINK